MTDTGGDFSNAFATDTVSGVLSYLYTSVSVSIWVYFMNCVISCHKVVTSFFTSNRWI